MKQTSGPARRFGWRFGAMLGIAALSLIVGFGVTHSGGPVSPGQPVFGYAGGGQPDPLTGVRHPMAPVPSSPLGTEADCHKRLGAAGEEYCSDLFLALDDLDTFWQDEFFNISKSGQKYRSPKAFTVYEPQGKHTKCDDPATPDLYCTPAAYLYDGTLTINEPYLMKIHQDGDFGAMIVLAHEWGHHIQNIQGRLTSKSEVTYTIQFELQADCYAGAWSHYEDFDTDHLESGDIDEALATAFSAGDEELDDWQDESAHGLSQQRVLAYRTGYVFGGSVVCNDWAKYDGQPVLDLGGYTLAITPPDESFDLKGGGYRIESGSQLVNTFALSKLTSASAQSQFPTIAKRELGANARLLDVYTPNDKPDRGKLGASDINKTSSYARMYELTENGETVHGIFYVNLRSAGGNGVALDVFQAGEAGDANWDPLQIELRYMILGLSLN